MKFVPVTPDELPNFREAHRGRVSYPITKQFLESNLPIAKLDRTGLDRSVGGLKSLLQWYCKGHKLPIKLVTRQGELYFIRTDMDEKGNKNPNWKWEDDLPPDDGNTAQGIPELDAEAVMKHKT